MRSKSIKKLWATLLVICLLFSYHGASAATDGTTGDNDIGYWENVISNNDLDVIYNYETNDVATTSASNDVSDRRENGSPQKNVVFQVVDDYDYVSSSYYNFDYISGNGYETDPTQIPGYDNPTGSYYVTSTPTPTEEPTPEPTAEPTPEPTTEPTTVPTAEPTIVPTAEPTPEPTATQAPTVTPKPTQVVTSTPVPTVPLIRPDPSGIIYVTPAEKTPQKVVYDVGLEVGRYAHFTTTQMTNDTKKSSNTKIINDPRSATGSFKANDYEALANNPGDATITFANSKEAFTEEWNIHVFCRPLDFEKTEYVVEMPKTQSYGYVTLFLKYFEYASEFAYDFRWDSSNKDVAIVYGGDSNSTFCRFRVAKEGATIITVSDKYGNSSKCVLIVKDPNHKEATPTTTPEVTPEPTKTPDVTPEPTKTPDVTPTPSGLTAKQLKKAVKATEVELTAVAKSGKTVLVWETTSESDYELDGYQVQVKKSNAKKFKTKKTIKKGSTITWKYTTGIANKTYDFRVRGYKVINGKKVYTQWSPVESAKFKK